jgi:hypothetical protein
MVSPEEIESEQLAENSKEGAANGADSTSFTGLWTTSPNQATSSYKLPSLKRLPFLHDQVQENIGPILNRARNNCDEC